MMDTTRQGSAAAYLNLTTIFVAIGLFLIYMYIFMSLDYDKTGLSLLGLLMVIQITPAAVVFSRGQFNYLSFVLLNHFVVYSVAKYNLLLNVQKTNVVNTGAMTAIREMIYCTILIIASYYISRFVMMRRPNQSEKYEFFQVTKRQYFWIGVYTFVQPFITLYLPPAVATIHLVTGGATLILLFCCRTDDTLMERYVKLSIFISAYYSFLVTGSLSMFGGLATIIFIVCFIQWKASNFLILITLALVGTVFQTVKSDYRIITRSNAEYSTFDQIMVLNELLVWKFVEGTPTNPFDQPEEEYEGDYVEKDEVDVSDTLAKGFARIGDDSLERVLQMTPSQVPFWEGETYTHIPYIFIPRLLWPDKPKREMWNKFGRVYGFLSDDDDQTSVGVNFLGEAYMNFGYTGLYSIACFFGFLITLMEVLSFYFLGRHTYFAFICFLIPIMGYGLDLGSILNSMVLMTCILLAMRYRLVLLLQKDAYS